MISVIVPVYNIEKYIGKCIQSVLSQTYTDFELLLINDGSKDSSGEICSSWAKIDARIRVISKENEGVSVARNLGIDSAKGEFIFFLDGDDWISPECLEKMLLRMTPEVDAVISEWDEPEDEGYDSVLITKKKQKEGLVSNEEIWKDIYESFFYPKVLWGKLYRKELWNNVRLKKGTIYSEDTYAMLEVFQNVRSLYSIQEPLYNYLQRGSGISQKLTTRIYEDYIKTLDFKYQIAQKTYPQFLELSGIEYIREAYILLEMYSQEHEKEKALRLIEKMKAVYRSTDIKQPIFSQKVLMLPTGLMYCWINIRKHLKRVSH